MTTTEKSNLNHYLDIANKLKSIKLCIIGKDPYPKNATGIPFSKSSGEMKVNGKKRKWKGVLENKNCSGYYLVNQLIDLQDNKHANYINNSDRLFIELLENNKIIFLNTSYELLGNLNKNERGEKIGAALDLNEQIVKKSEVVIYLGDSEYCPLYCNINSNTKKLLHPSPFNRNNKKTKTDWEKLYQNKNGLLNEIRPTKK